MTTTFWILFGLIAFSLVGYGFFWIVLASIMPRRQAPDVVPQKATMLIAARNEAAAIADKVRSVLDQESGPHDLDILVVSDGSDDGTEQAVLDIGSGSVRVFSLSDHQGKAAALNAGLATIEPSRIVIFSDANSMVRPGSVRALLDAFADPKIGGAIGRLEIAKKGGFLAKADRLFWAYDHALKAAEDRVAGTVSAQGTLYAIRRNLIDRVPEAMADDLAISLGAVARGGRLKFVPAAAATEKVTSRTSDEFGRRVRSTERGWRGLMHYASLMNPVRHGLYAIQLFCHKFLRRAVAFLLPVFFIVSLIVAPQGPFYAMMAIGQVLVYAMGIGAVYVPALGRIPGASVASLFTMGHVAMAQGILRAARGHRSVKWVPVRTED